MITKQKLEELCIRYLDTLDPVKAYELCGLEGDPTVEGMRLLSCRSARRMLKRLTDPESLYTQSIAGLMKLAFGSRGEVLESVTPDLFCVSEFKRTKDGGEVKYLNRLEAIEKLCELCQRSDAKQSAESFFSALGDMSKSDKDE